MTPDFLRTRSINTVTKTLTDSVRVTKPVTVPDSVTKTLTDSVRGIKQTNEQTITTVLSTYENDDLEKSFDLQNSVMNWVQFFVREKKFQIHEAQTAKTVPMFVDWVQSGVTVADVELAMIAAHNWLKGKRADNPTVYRKFVKTVMAEKQKKRSDGMGSDLGFPNNTRVSYDTNRKRNEARSGANGKLSLAEQADRDIELLENRLQQEEGEHERVIN